MVKSPCYSFTEPSGTCVAKASDNGEIQKVDFTDLTGLSWNDIERGKWKGWFSMTPKQVSEWLIRVTKVNIEVLVEGVKYQSFGLGESAFGWKLVHQTPGEIGFQHEDGRACCFNHSNLKNGQLQGWKDFFFKFGSDL